MNEIVVDYHNRIIGRTQTMKLQLHCARLRLRKVEDKLMHRFVSVYGRKIFSVALVFNSLLTVACAVGILSGFYAAYPYWKPFEPYLLDGNLFWLIIAAAVINIFPAAHIGKVHTGRLWFHHYVYGFAVLFSASAWTTLFTSVSLFNLFFINTTDITVNVGRFFFLGGLTLILDDLPDVSKATMHTLRWLKSRACQAQKIIHAVQFIMGLVASYFFLVNILYILTNSEWGPTVANLLLAGTLLVTALTCFANVTRKIWLNLEPEQNPSK